MVISSRSKSLISCFGLNMLHRTLTNCSYEIVQFFGISVLPSGASCDRNRKSRNSTNSDSIPNAFQTCATTACARKSFTSGISTESDL